MPQDARTGKAAASFLAMAVGVVALAAIAVTAPAQLLADEFAAADASAAAIPPKLDDRPIADAARLEDSGAQARLVFELSAPIEATAFVLAGPDRVIVDLPQVAFSIDPEIGKASKPRRQRTRLVKAAGLITSFRFGQLGQGKSRIVIDLGAPARVLRANCETGAGEAKSRLVIELARTDRAAFAAAVRNARAALAEAAGTKTAEKVPAAPDKPIVMIDPGHGGIDRGAMVNGLIEKDLVFDFAKALAAKLAAGGRVMTVMTRDDDSFVPLSERVRMARDDKAALFVSIHADTLSDASDVAGATVYTVSDRASDAEAARVAEKENQSDAAAGLDWGDAAPDVSDILFDLTRRETRAYSHVFARTLVNYWKFAGRLNKNPQRSAGFRVLKAPDVPSVLLELGYLSNEKDDVALTSAEWRDKASSRVAEAIEAFFAARGNAGAVTAADKDQAPVTRRHLERGSATDANSSEDENGSVKKDNAADKNGLGDNTSVVQAPSANAAGKLR